MANRITRSIHLPLTILWIAALLLLPLAEQLPKSYAAAQAQDANIDAMLVLDVSNSMSTSDVNKIGNEAMKMFIDMLSPTGDKVGVIAYTDKIEREKALLEMNQPQDKEALKTFIDDLNRGPYTDIAVGLNEAVKVLEQGTTSGHEPMIVLFADGNNYLNSKGSRTQEQSDKELNEAVEIAKKIGAPIYTVGLNADGQLNASILEDLSNRTGGKSFVTSSAEDLPRILSEIFASHQKLKVVPVDTITANGDYQDVVIDVPNGNVKEANISLMSSQPVDVRLKDPTGKEVAVPSNDVLLSRSKSYSLVKLLQPAEGKWTLQVKGVPKDKIDISLVFNYDLALVLEDIPSKSLKPGDKVDIKAYLASNGAKLPSDELYPEMNAVLKVKDLDTGDTSEVKLDLKGDHFGGTFKIADKHDYELVVRAEGDSFYRETAPVTVSGKSGAGSESAALEEPSVPTWVWIAAGIALVLLAVAGFFIFAAVKKANRGFVGQMVIEIRDDNTGEKSSPQYRKLTAFRGKFNLHQLLQLAPEMKETEGIVFTPGSEDRVVLHNSSPVVVEKSGRAVDASRGHELKSGDRLTIPLTNVDKTITLEYLK
ncbi:vWA domain-containing protein [Paenibacillus sp. 1001270B_150601_E10]|uniref:vWA domain-containing protein n=1 Tax=Paenibacillus sp. 1001270B_150601_E10 TaxID=2787079 RepID=UPI00189F2B56|nr:vWA domain-containing protein [Paenibacillus sp. 1001270B_150601_E10]